MPEGPFPPFVEPTGPARDDADVVAAYARDEPAGHSARFHVERPTLIVGRDVAAAIRVGPRTVLVRDDLPDDLVAAKADVEEALFAAGMTRFDEETLLATPVALQLLGIRLSTWDLWGADIDEAFADLRAACLGESPPPFA